MKNIMLISEPIDYPLAGGSKVISYNLLKYNTKHKFYYFSHKLKINNHYRIKIPKYKKNNSLRNKAIILYNMLKFRNEIDIYHIMMTPDRLSGYIFKFIKIITHKKIILSSSLSNKKDFRSYNNFDLCITYSEFMKKRLLENNIKKVMAVQPGIPAEDFKIRMKHKDFNVIYCGEYGSYSTIIKILNIAKMVKEKNQDIGFILACRIKKQEDILLKKELLKKSLDMDLTNVKWYDTVPDIKEVFNQGDIIIMPIDSINEKKDIPIALLEGISMGLIPIISDIAPMNELKIDKTLKINKNDWEKMANLIIKIHKNYNQYNPKEFHNLIRKVYNIHDFIKKYNLIYENENL